MGDRFFSNNIQYQAVLLNLKKNDGQLKCASCGKKLVSKSECHFDHIKAYAKGGKSTLDNCQILCGECNLAKSDKELQDFIMEEKARRFMSGENINNDAVSPKQGLQTNYGKITKERFDAIVSEFISVHGGIKQVDFTREKNGLPSVVYIKKYYGSLKELKKAFGLKVDEEWNRERIWKRLEDYSKINPGFKQSDLVKANDLPSLPCVLSHFPEFNNFSDIKIALGLELNYELWSEEKIFKACRRFLKSHTKITQKDLRKENGLPTPKVVYSFYGTMQAFQKAVGSEVSKSQEFISKKKIIEVTKEITDQFGNKFKSRADFLKAFPYSLSVIFYRFKSFDSFAEETNIVIVNAKKAKYTKQEVDDSILSYLKKGNPIPNSSKGLSNFNLPSSSTILRFYDSWKEPFIVFSKMINMAK